MKQKTNNTEELQKCKESPLYFYNKYASCKCKCDGCGKIYHEPNIKMEFGQFNICDDCTSNPKIQFE